MMGVADFAADRSCAQQPPTKSKKRARDDDDELLLLPPSSKESTRDQDHPQLGGDSDGSAIVQQDHDDDDLPLDFLHSPCIEDDEPGSLAFNMMGFGEEVKKTIEKPPRLCCNPAALTGCAIKSWNPSSAAATDVPASEILLF